jgi:hypothetical protein
MADYKTNYEYFRGTIEEAMADAETYIETLVAATSSIIDISIVGDNNFITILVLNNTP